MSATVSGGGARITLSEIQTRNLTEAPPAHLSLPKAAPEKWYAYTTTLDCGGRPGIADSEDLACQHAIDGCKNVPNATGLATVVWTRLEPQTPGTDSASNWTQAGTTCWPDLVPEKTGENQGPSLRQLINQAFHQLPFATPRPTFQPHTTKPFINKDVYLTTGFNPEGNQPGEARTTTLLGHQVTITPTLIDATYTWGDGATTGPTTDLGAPWPNGTIKHTYTAPGTYPVTITTTYSATFSIDGGPQQQIGLTTTRTTTQNLTPVEYHVHLVG